MQIGKDQVECGLNVEVGKSYVVMGKYEDDQDGKKVLGTRSLIK